MQKQYASFSIALTLFVFGMGFFIGSNFQLYLVGEEVLAAGCGDGNLEYGENCDDGGWCNGTVEGTHCLTDADCGGTPGSCQVVGGDGCDATCNTEIGTCGNGVIEWRGEACDDGNTTNGDGCNSTCQIECTLTSECQALAGQVSPCWCNDFNQPVCKYTEVLGGVSAECYAGTCQTQHADTCTEPQAPITGGGGSCGVGGGNPCEDEDICGDGRITGIEECDVGGICTGSNRAGYNGRHCFDLDPSGYRFYGVQRCVATGGTCVPRGGHGCTVDCLEECYTNSVPCFTDDDCGDCVEGVCVGGICQEVSTAAVCGNWVKEGTEECDDGNVVDGDGCSALCVGEGLCDGGGQEACDAGVCPTSAKKWQITFSGVQNNSCNLCTTLNATIELSAGAYEGNYCSNCDHCWVGPDLCEYGGGELDTSRLYLSYDGVDWNLTLRNESGASPEEETVYWASGATWNCNSANTMSWVGTTEWDTCIWPETDITVTPVGEVECVDYGWP